MLFKKLFGGQPQRARAQHALYMAAVAKARDPRLYLDHVAGIDEQAAHRVAEGFRRVLDDMSASAAAAGQQTDSFGDSNGVNNGSGDNDMFFLLLG